MRILITRPRPQAIEFAQRLRTSGFEPIFFPVIEIRPIEDNIALDRALDKLNCYEWVVFTSVNAVNVVFDTFSLSFLNGEGLNVKFAAIGPKTAEALKRCGV